MKVFVAEWAVPPGLLVADGRRGRGAAQAGA